MSDKKQFSARSQRYTEPLPEGSKGHSALVACGEITVDALIFLAQNGATVEKHAGLHLVVLPAHAVFQSLGTGDYVCIFEDDEEHSVPYLLIEHEINAYDTRIEFHTPDC